jgi:predicted nucleic acid-binding protein
VKVLVDTSVWSLALRRRTIPIAQPAVEELRRLIASGRAAMVGPIRQELLSGIRDQNAFARLRAQLDAFPDEPIVTADYERAAEHFDACRARGLPGSNTDFLLCAIAQRRRMAILTTDEDFSRYAKVMPLVLHPPVS